MVAKGSMILISKTYYPHIKIMFFSDVNIVCLLTVNKRRLQW